MPAVLELREEATPGEVTLLVDLQSVTDLTHPQFHYTSLCLSTLAYGLHCYRYLQWRAVGLFNLIRPLRDLSQSFDRCSKTLMSISGKHNS